MERNVRSVRERSARPAGAGVVVHCAGCGETSPVDLRAAVRALVPLAVWLPWREHPLFAVCPSCGGRRWLRPTLHTGGDRP